MVKRSRIVAFILVILLFAGLAGATTQNILKNIKLGLDLQGGFEVLYQVEPAKKGQKITKEVLQNTADALDRRINVLGVSEPSIQIEGNNRIRVQLAGVEDQNEARKILSTQANLTFRDVNDKVRLDGTDLVSGKAKQTFDDKNNPIVSLQLKDKDAFYNLTKDLSQKPYPDNKLVIWLDFEEGKDSYKAEAKKADPKFISDPQVSKPINSSDVQITGNFTIDEAKNLASLLNAGALPVKLKETYSTSVGAKFGEQAMHKTILAGIIGISIIFLFMLFYYRIPGLVAVVTLSIYIYLILVIFDWMNGVLTLPGIAALILGVGMAVDANIITYERIKEEIKVGKSIRAAFQAGNKSSFMTILDANLTTILAGIVLFIYGTSSVKGFATMLIVSILASFITAVFGSRLLLGLLVNSRALKGKPSLMGVKKGDVKDIAENFDTLDLPTRFDKFDFVKPSKKFFGYSIITVLLGLIFLIIFQLNLGIDFTHGTRVELLSKSALTKDQIESQFDELHLKPDTVVLSGKNNEIGVAQFKGVLSQKEIADLKTSFTKKLGNEPNVSTVSPTIGKELARNAIKSVIIASIGIIIYVTLRFELYMALAAIIALLYDAFFIIGVFSITRLEVDLTFIAAVLTIVGYSINDTIVTFDRIRENMAKKRRIKTPEELEEVVNKSVRQTFTRSVNTVLTVVITVVAMLIFGSESIRNFSIALLIGLLSGAYSSIFIASQLWLVWKKKELKKKGTIKTVKEKKKWSDEPQV
ncbi:protein translocase subunit SecDF [Falsibacillus pallidus]|uniref:Multifunctional fusion protein n=1 Tax=Falsibacillus pallidus TaxID=493781 RepID=A0A370GKE3_9BACI|nr:protein translocase subunit SecDF [Falsibacillus pallidus]RDI44117.1 protein translocase subunit secF /protein translocase subunit secD [Falsibacillus pallidus]